MKKIALMICTAMLAAGVALAQDEDKKKGDADKGKETFEQCGACHNTIRLRRKWGRH